MDNNLIMNLLVFGSDLEPLFHLELELQTLRMQQKSADGVLCLNFSAWTHQCCLVNAVRYYGKIDPKKYGRCSSVHWYINV